MVKPSRVKKTADQVLEKMKCIAVSRGGRCLSDGALRVVDVWRFECGNGHRFSMKGSMVLHKGGWCKKCKQAEMVNRVGKAAKDSGGICLNKAWKPTDEEWSFQCRNGHRLKKRAQLVLRNGLFCRRCEEEEKYAAVVDAASQCGAICLERRYRALGERWRFECENGHRIKRRGNHVLNNGLSCDRCDAEEKANQVREAAESLGWTVTKSKARALKDTWLFRCENGHRIRRSGAQVIADGGTCEECVKDRLMGDAIAIAESRGGAVLTKEFGNTLEDWEFQCENGHKFKRRGSEVIHRGLWCNKCTNRAPGAMLKKVQQVAKERGGMCLSKRYVSSPKTMRFVCKEGHRWSAIASNIVHQGQWCPRCAATPTDAYREKLETFVLAKGGVMLSPKLGALTDLHRFRCQKGHVFKQSPTRIVHKGTWCPKCAYLANADKKRIGIEAVREKAREMGGECLSDHYETQNDRGWFRCAEGH